MSNKIGKTLTAALGKICGGNRPKRAASTSTANAEAPNTRKKIGSLLTKVKACASSVGAKILDCLTPEAEKEAARNLARVTAYNQRTAPEETSFSKLPESLSTIHEAP